MKKYLILSKSVYETKLALLEDNKLDEMYIERNNQKEITGNIYKGKVVDAVVEGVNFEIPEAVVEREIQFQINRFAQQLQMQGMSLNQYFEMTGQNIEKMRESIKESAEKSVKRDLVLTEIAKAENIQATEEEVNAELDRTALMYGMDREGLIAEVRKSGNYARFIDEIKYQIINRKTVDLLAK